MQNPTALEKLDSSVSQILNRYKQLQKQLKALQDENRELKLDAQLHTKRIGELEDSNALKELEIQEIVAKIETMLDTDA